MYEIDKRAFGAFVAQLRREKGYTQKDLAAKLFLSDKAVSKWETGASIPDTALLMPLAGLLGVSVTELLLCRRVEEGLDSEQVEDLVQQAIHYQGHKPVRTYPGKKRWAVIYGLCVLGGLPLFLHEATFGWSAWVLGLIFGAYFCFLAPRRLADFYDQNKINGMLDGPLRMNIPGLYFNNRNWPYIVLVGRIWCCCAMAVFPALEWALSLLKLGNMAMVWVYLTLLLGGLFVPLYIVGKKYE